MWEKSLKKCVNLGLKAPKWAENGFMKAWIQAIAWKLTSLVHANKCIMKAIPYNTFTALAWFHSNRDSNSSIVPPPLLVKVAWKHPIPGLKYLCGSARGIKTVDSQGP